MGKWGNGCSQSLKSLHRLIMLRDRKSTRLNSSHQIISYAVFCLKKKKTTQMDQTVRQPSREAIAPLFLVAREHVNLPSGHPRPVTFPRDHDFAYLLCPNISVLQ